MNPSSAVTRWLNYQAKARQNRTDKTDKRVTDGGSVSFVSLSSAHECPEIQAGRLKARVRGHDHFEQAYAPDPCWHCRGLTVL